MSGMPRISITVHRRPTGRWYFVVTLLSFGFLAWVPFAHAAYHLPYRTPRRLAVSYALLAVAVIILMSVTPTDRAGNPIGTTGSLLVGIVVCALIGMMAMGCIQCAALRRRVYGLPPLPAELVPSPGSGPMDDPAVAAVHRARARRAAARELASRDLLMARELRIGRPDLPGSYDDGGLVDLNGAPATAIAQVCGIPLHHAERIVSARDRVGGAFLTVEDVFTMTDLPVSSWDVLRDHAILLPT